MERIDAIVVWHNPSQKEAEAIITYNQSVGNVYVVDNSESDNRTLLATIPNAVYMPLRQNMGIAYALNRGCEAAMNAGAEWVLTMDQDSLWNRTPIADYLAQAMQYPHINDIALFAPYHDYGVVDKHVRPPYQEEEMVMCSGNLLRISAWQKTGGFREDFFIDEVDDELCLHLRQLGYHIIRINTAVLQHSLGEGPKDVRLIHHTYIPHPAWRQYYMGRNMKKMQQLYPEKKAYYQKMIRKRIKRLWLYDWDDKINKLTAFYRGLRDGSSAEAIVKK